MSDIRNGMSATELTGLRWCKSGRSNPNGNCVELAALPDQAGVAVRNSRDPHGPVLVYTQEEIIAFLAGAKAGDFDHLI
jgi:hypothetical protein